MNLRKEAYKFALANAYSHKGTAVFKAVLGQLLNLDPKLKNKMKSVAPIIKKEIEKVNSMMMEEQEAELKMLYSEFFAPKEARIKELPTLKKTKGKIVLRFAPSPSGPLHIGHSYPLALNAGLALKNKGQMILRLEDTNPANILPEAYKMIPEDASWLLGKKVKTYIQSDRMDIYYKWGETLLKRWEAYVCTCTAEKFRTLLHEKKPCPCRGNTTGENMKRWEKMLSGGYKEGGAVVRIKTDLEHKNPAMRDWPAFRINKKKHPKHGTKYKVWPLMNFAVAIDDYEMGVTHTVRAKDHMDNERKQQYIYDYMKWQAPNHFYIGRINFEDLKLSTTKIKQAIKEGKYMSWEDPRLPFLKALKKRGYQAEAFIKLAEQIGLTETDKKVSIDEFFKNINALNKEIIDPKANRYFFIANPVKKKIKNAPKLKAEHPIHPNFPRRGKRKFQGSSEFYLEKDDVSKFRNNQLIRLMGLLNFKVKQGQLYFDSKEYEKAKEKKAKLIHWLPVSKSLVKATVIMPDNSKVKGWAEPGIKKLKEDEVIQFERVGFCRLDNKKNMIFYYAHN